MTGRRFATISLLLGLAGAPFLAFASKAEASPSVSTVQSQTLLPPPQASTPEALLNNHLRDVLRARLWAERLDESRLKTRGFTLPEDRAAEPAFSRIQKELTDIEIVRTQA